MKIKLTTKTFTPKMLDMKKKISAINSETDEAYIIEGTPKQKKRILKLISLLNKYNIKYMFRRDELENHFDPYMLYSIYFQCLIRHKKLITYRLQKYSTNAVHEDIDNIYIVPYPNDIYIMETLIRNASNIVFHNDVKNRSICNTGLIGNINMYVETCINIKRSIK